ncbi:hypothetical protein HY641_00965 [Candidatus Woesearchaeota archaeon]|nr:hypothetical protein [Candidatus Woesearchaeota archaeon]
MKTQHKEQSIQPKQFQNMFSSSWKHVSSSWKLLGVSVIFDLAFLLIVSYVLLLTFQAVAAPIKEIQDISGSLVLNDLQPGSVQTRFMEAYGELMAALGVMFVSVLAAWVLLQGVAWCVAHRMAKSKISIARFSRRFVLITFLACVSLLVMFAVVGNIGAVLNNGFMVPSSDLLGYVSLIGVIVVFYLTVLGYASIPSLHRWRDYISVLVSHWRASLVAYAANLVIIVLANVLTSLALGISLWLTYGLILLVLPAYAYGRVLMIESVKTFNDPSLCSGS